jgi:CHAT domain-containing protein/tetratricopeptide (TPR) repeat protein
MTAWARRGDRRDAARAALGMVATYEQLGRLHDSLRSGQAALEMAKGAADDALEAEVQRAVGQAQAYVAETEEAYGQARDHCRKALALSRRLGDARAEVRALNCIGEAAYYHQRPEEALELYRDAERVSVRAGDAYGRAQALFHQGCVHSDSNRFDQAQALYEAARAVWLERRDEREQAITRVAVARLALRRGRYQEALDEFQGALERLRPMGDGVGEGSALTGIARVYLDMADTGSALRYWEEALRVFEAIGLRSVVVDVLMSLGEGYLAFGDDTKALDTFKRALALSRELGIERWQAVALRYIGAVHLRGGQPDEALRHLESSLALEPVVADRRLEAQTRADLAEVRLLLGDPSTAARQFGDALALSRSAGDRVSEARGLFGLARTAARAGDLDTARRHVEGALRVAESLRTATENRDLRASYIASVYGYHEFQMDVLMRLDRSRPGRGLAAAAFGACERARARSLLDSLTEGDIDLRQGVDSDLLKREQVLKRAFSDWEERHARLGRAPETAAFAEEYRDLEHRYDQVQAEIRGRSPRYAALTRPRPLGLEAIQQQVLDPDTLLLEYALGEERSYVWAVSKAGYVSAVLPPRARIEGQAKKVHELLTSRLRATGSPGERRRTIEEADDAYWKEAADLSAMILGPVAGKLAGQRLLVVADGALQYVPFAALPDPGAGTSGVPLAVLHEVVGLPSASVLAVLRNETRGREPARKAVAVLADPVFEHDDPRLRAGSDGTGSRVPVEPGRREFPRLAASRQEAAGIVAVAPEGTTLLATGFRANRATATSAELARYGIVHFATHGIFDDEHPERSGIVLSMFDERGKPRDGFLRLHDVYELKLPTELVVLSACDTALGREVRGEGLVGMVRGFMYAGSKRVVASLWKVDDEATGELMRTFYKGMLQEGRSPADALRQAQLDQWHSRRWHAPYYWAAFVLQGEPR